MRVPLQWFQWIMDDLKVDPNKTKWNFVTAGGNRCKISLVKGENWGPCLDMDYNEED